MAPWSSVPLRRNSSGGSPLIFNPHEELFIWKKMKLSEWRRRCGFVLMSVCLTTENVFRMNSEQTDSSITLFSVTVFSFRSVQIIFSHVFYYCFSLFTKPLAMASGLIVTSDTSATVRSETGVRGVFAESIHRWTVSLNKHFDYYCCFLTWNTSKPLHTTSCCPHPHFLYLH